MRSEPGLDRGGALERRRRLQFHPVLVMCASAMLALGAPRAHAADAWPLQPVRIVVAQAPGGPPDLIARVLEAPLERAWGVPIVIENRPGASGIIGVDAAARAKPDGYTLLVGTQSTHALVPHVSARVPYDPIRDFVPVANLFRSIKVLWVNAALPIRDVRQWIADAKARPGAIDYASGGVGSSNHVDMEAVAARLGLSLHHVPYNGPAAAIAAVAKGDAQAMIVSIGTGLPLAQAGRVRPLVVFADRRSPLLPDVPTATEQGLGRHDLSAWIGIFAPKGTPEPIVTRANADLVRILAMPEIVAWAARQGLEIVGGSPASFAANVADDYRRWGELIRTLELTPQ
jgi:tripartite-type tricarboxylate transporter receptor subunit TctC